MKILESQLRNSTILAVIFSILGGASIGFVMGVKYRTEKHVCPGEIVIVPGYTKISYGKGINAAGDTVNIFEYADR